MEVEPFKVHLWSSIRYPARLHRQRSGHRTKPRQSLRHHQHETADVRQGYTKAHRLHGCIKPKGLPFFKLLKASELFSWSEEADTAFEQLKLFLTKLPIMMAPQLDETLLIYITATSRVVSIASVVEHEEAEHAYKVQC